MPKIWSKKLYQLIALSNKACPNSTRVKTKTKKFKMKKHKKITKLNEKNKKRKMRKHKKNIKVKKTKM